MSLLSSKAFLAAAPGLALLVACAVIAARAEDPSVTPTGEVPSGYVLSWQDEFNGNVLDAVKWDYRTDSKAWSTQLPANVSVGDGLLHLALKKESVSGKEYTGGGVISKALFQYGYYEARMKVPAGAGWHTSIWTMKQDGHGTTLPTAAAQELDICEQDSVKLMRYSAGIFDWAGAKKGKSVGRKHTDTSDLSAEFHVWGGEYTPQTVRFYFDGKLTHEVATAQFTEGDQHIWLTSIAFPGSGTKAVDDAKLPAEALFDYVRYFRPPTPR